VTRAQLPQDFTRSSTPLPWRVTPGEDQRRQRWPGRPQRHSSRPAVLEYRHGVAGL